MTGDQREGGRNFLEYEAAHTEPNGNSVLG